MTKYNVLHIISDQHQAACTGYEGHPQALTPNLDRLAAEGVWFRHAYAQNIICTPSRVSIFSGQYCHNHGYYGLSGPTPRSLPSFLQHFSNHGYRTAAIGKLHVPDDPVDWLLEHVHWWRDYNREPARGAGSRGRHGAYFRYLDALGLRDREDYTHLPECPQAGKTLEGRPSLLPYEHSVEGWCVQEAVRFLDDCGDRPFCLHVSLPRPHQTCTPDQRFWDLYPDDIEPPPTLRADPSGRPPHFRAAVEGFRKQEGFQEPKGFLPLARRIWRSYLACITQVDHAVGELLAYLERTGTAERTIVIYNTDHGGYSGTHGVEEKAPGISSEAVCRTPMVWRAPGVTHNGAACRQLVESVDIAPTITALCGLPPMPSVDGKDITPLLRGEDRPVREAAVTEAPWSRSLRWKSWRFVHYQRAMFGGEDVGELYDIEKDPDEQRNLYHDPDHQSVVQECRRRLLEWLIATSHAVTVHPVHPDGIQGLVEEGQCNYL